MCDSPLDYLYYIEQDDMNNIFYEGYKHSSINFIGGKWRITDRVVKNSNFTIETEASTPLRRNVWTTNIEGCNSANRSLTLTTCTVGKEFSCDSGQCINIYRRCDSQIDCLDESDEKNCKLIRLPPEYDKSEPPEVHGREEPNPLHIEVEIMNIDEIDTSSMVVGLTVKIRITWKDPKLIFENFENREKHGFSFVSNKEANEIWLPMDKIIHENAIIGKVSTDKTFYVKVSTDKTFYVKAMSICSALAQKITYS